ncbi:MAG TPA: DUF692 domain-containing protein [Gammaproteobacteria bacterium]|nr:DUF692 domain-containing protein [Gammaproteobacteria bacterium]
MYSQVNGSIPARAGIGLRAPHFQAVLDTLPEVAWFEAHSENYFGIADSGQLGGVPLHYLQRVREHYPVSLHGVGLSLGSVDPLDRSHLKQLKTLIEIIEPGLVSEHLSWSSVDGQYFNDLLPLPYTEEALVHLVERVSATQDFLGRQILVENASSYLEFADANIPEWEFIAELARRADCKILLDVNNVYVNAMNHGFDPQHFLQAVPVDLVEEIHLAGHTVKTFGEGVLRIDTHDQLVCDAVWDLYESAVQRFPHVPVLIEWDSRLPELDVLLAEAARADGITGIGEGERHARLA